MAITVGELQVMLEAQTQDFRQGLRAAERRTDAFTQRVQRSGGRIDRFNMRLRSAGRQAGIAAVAITGLGVAFFAATRRAISAADEIAKSARAANLTGTAFQRLSIASQEAGVSQNLFARSLILFNRNIAEASEGVGPAAEAFDFLGLSVSNADGSLREADELFLEVADRLRNVEDGARRTQLSFDLFGRSGAQLAPLLRQGSDAIRAVGDEAERTGQILGEDALANAEALNDAFDRLRRAAIVPLQSALIAFAPVFLDLAANVLPAVGRGITLAVNAFRLLRAGFATTQAVIVALLSPLTLFIRNLLDLIDLARTAGRGIGQIFSGDITEGFNTLRNVGTEAISRFRTNVEQTFNEVGVAADLAKDRFREFSEDDPALEQLNMSLQATATNIRRVRAELDQPVMRAMMDPTVDGAPGGITPAERMAEAARGRAATSLVTLTRTLREAREAAGEPLRAEIQSLDQQIEQTRALGIEAGNEVLAQEAINRLIEERIELTARLGTAQQQFNVAQRGVSAALGELLRLDPAQAMQIGADFADAIRSAEGAEARAEIARDFQIQIGEAIGNAASMPGVTAGLADLFKNGSELGLDEGFSNALASFAELFDGVLDGVGDKLGDLFGEGGPLSGVGGFLQDQFGGLDIGAAVTGAVGLGRTIAGAFNNEVDVTPSASQISSAVQSVQRVRGIISGPTSIGVAQVERGLGDALIPSERLLARIEENTRATAVQTSDTGTGSVPSGGTSEATQALANEGPSLV